MRRIGKAIVDKITPRLIWDLFMVWVAVINLSLIAFDLTYLMMRPVYFRWVPVVTRIYDPVKGIEPHPLTDEIIDRAEAAEQLLALDPDSQRLAEQLDGLGDLTARMLLENPFERSGQTRNLEVIRRLIADETGIPAAELHTPGGIRTAASEFWSGPAALLRHRFELFEQTMRPLLAMNYFRQFDLAGHLEDHFWLIDLPFLVLFWIEFVVRWIIAVRRHTHARWFFFPIFNWYDLLGLIPVAHFRVFRLVRIASIYMRLRRSELSNVGRDAISRSVAWISNIITEEVSDRVAVRILDEVQEELRDGTHRRIISATLMPRRTEVEEVLARQIRDLLTDVETLDSFRELLRLNLERAVDSSDALRGVPLPNAVLRPVIRTVGEVVAETTIQTVGATLESEEGQLAVRRMASAVIDRTFGGPGVDEAEGLLKEILLQVIDHMKETVAVKKWALPDDQKPEKRLADAAADAILE